MSAEPPKSIVLTRENLQRWPAYEQLYENGKIVFDQRGRLRYSHGAPVGRLILVRIASDGSPVYNESAEEWFDPESERAREFVWPKKRLWHRLFSWGT